VFLSEAVSCRREDRFGSALRSPEKQDKKRLATTIGFLRKNAGFMLLAQKSVDKFEFEWYIYDIGSDLKIGSAPPRGAAEMVNVANL
jgi:hypothetical protein